MTAMPKSGGRFQAVLGTGWLLLGLAAWLYARAKNLAGPAAFAVGAAFLAEFPCYISAGFDAVRHRLASLGKIRLAALMLASALAPYLISSEAAGSFDVRALLLLAAIAGVAAFWYVLLPVCAWTDAALLILLAATLLSGVFDRIYISPLPKLSISILGHLMLIRTAAWAVLGIRGAGPNGGGIAAVEARFNFWPDAQQWLTGLRYFAALLPAAGVALWSLGLARLRPHPLNAGLALATFFGILWVVALSEEFFFRGLLQPWIAAWTGSSRAGLLATSLLFGSAHLAFQHRFPNWRFAIVAAIAGYFYGLASQRGRGVQASMVTHALTVTLWRVFFQ